MYGLQGGWGRFVRRLRGGKRRREIIEFEVEVVIYFESLYKE